eukprot:TRINITY_DN81562_c0_g1_i1.p1 TRINITY_DN81562_c0_g1~~TRINITY_DN81562_c0_g1_i1.p1  ORF type:complete len:380 (-),score=110.52 TRINITY_DN81562_c0_g1_i1:108-1247(-)
MVEQQSMRTSVSDTTLRRPLLESRPDELDMFQLARRGTLKIFAKRADEREVLKTQMVREEQLSFDRMVAHYNQRSRSWARKLQGNPLAADQLALDNKAYRKARQRNAAEQRHLDWEKQREKKIRHGVIQRAAAEGKDELTELRAEKRRLLEMEYVLKAQRDCEKLEERVANMGAPRRSVKYLIPAKEKHVKPAAPPKVATDQDWDHVCAVKMATEIMHVADRGSKNGLVSVGELLAFLSSNIKYKSFLDWLMADSKKRFREFDADKSGDMSLPELHKAVGLFVEEQQKKSPSPVKGDQAAETPNKGAAEKAAEEEGDAAGWHEEGEDGTLDELPDDGGDDSPEPDALPPSEEDGFVYSWKERVPTNDGALPPSEECPEE